MGAAPKGHEFVEVTSRGYTRDGVTYREGAVLLLPEPAAEYACDQKDPPHCRRIPEEEALERNLPRKLGLIEEVEPEPEPPEPGSPELPYRFRPPALGVLNEAGVDPQVYDGPADEDGTVSKEHVETWLASQVDASDKAREIADHEGVDLTDIKGTGKNGRVLAKDVRAHLDGG